MRAREAGTPVPRGREGGRGEAREPRASPDKLRGVGLQLPQAPERPVLARALAWTCAPEPGAARSRRALAAHQTLDKRREPVAPGSRILQIGSHQRANPKAKSERVGASKRALVPPPRARYTVHRWVCPHSRWLHAARANGKFSTKTAHVSASRISRGTLGEHLRRVSTQLLRGSREIKMGNGRGGESRPVPACLLRWPSERLHASEGYRLVCFGAGLCSGSVGAFEPSLTKRKETAEASERCAV